MLTLNFSPFPTLTTDRLVLREVSQKDVKEMLFMRSDKRVMKYIDRVPAKSIEDASAFIQKINDLKKNNEAVTWAITVKDNPVLIGTICLWNIKKEHYRAEVGYALHPEHHKKGIMQEALKAVLEYGFRIMQLHSVEANVNPQNSSSINLLERNGFVREAYFKEDYFFNGKFIDSAIYSLLTPVK